jgi:predicted ester cyclase
MIEAIKMLHSAFADLHYEEEGMVSSGNKVVAVMSVSGRHAGDYAGILATGRSFSTSDVVIFKIANGKILESSSYRDRLRFLIQIGVLGPSSHQYDHFFQVLKESVL